jgi:lipopolysaccharide export system protein LptA
MYQLLSKLLIILLSTLLSFLTSAHALSNDRYEKMYITADASTYNYKTGTNSFVGHVNVTQGTSHVTADRLTTKNNNHKIQEAIAYGTQELAHYWTQPKNGEEPMHAHAKIIKFYPLQDNVILESDAIVTQGKNSFQGQLIFYNIKNQTINVPPSKNGRAVLIYSPDK